jgi:lactoylglutathione lyase
MPAANQRLTDIHHIGLTISDIEESIHFYRDMLGLTLVRRREVDADYVGQQTGYPGVRLSTASFKVRPDTQSIEMVQYRNYVGERNDTATNRAGNTHLCFQTTHIRDLIEHLRARGVRFRSEPVTITSGPNEGGLVIYVYDPDQYIVELFQPPT